MNEKRRKELEVAGRARKKQEQEESELEGHIARQTQTGRDMEGERGRDVREFESLGWWVSK